MLGEDVEHPVNCAVIAVAKKIVRELSKDGATVSLQEFEKLASGEVADIEQSIVRQNPQDLLGVNDEDLGDGDAGPHYLNL
eukprot:2131916-Prymnesium_polylepis.1